MSLARIIEDEKPTLNAQVLSQLRADIVDCHLMPNERLRLEALRNRYGVGGSPIREALMRLEAEGLVQLEQNKGFSVSAVSRDSLLDLMRTRIEIEGLALRWSIERGGVEWEANILGAFHRLSHHKKADPTIPNAISAAWRREHRAFHAALAEACGSPMLLAIRSGLFAQAERYVALSILSKAKPRDDVAEHESIMRAALTRDVARAVALNNQHIERTTEKVASTTKFSRHAVKLVISRGRK
jgi:GntR family transcriptional regulator, carbon starvation induced regulator